MGSGNRIECTNCDYGGDLMTGGGIGPWFREPCIDTLVMVLEGREKARVLNLQEFHNGKLVGYPSNDYCFCPSCNTIHTRFFYRIKYNDDKTYTSNHPCPTCSTQLVQIEDDVEVDFSDYNCPKCGKKSLIDLGISIMWD
jgi:Zn finger protein HypA/HybF involved in hydrogenase expression